MKPRRVVRSGVPTRVLMVLGLFLLACGGSKEAPENEPAPKAEPAPDVPALDQAGAKRAVEALKSAAPEVQPRLAAVALAELEAGRVPASLVEGLEAAEKVSPDMVAMVLAQAISQNLALLDEACGRDGAALMKSLATMDVEARDQAVWDGCSFERHGLMTEADRSRFEPTMAILAHMVVVAVGRVSEEEKALLRAMMVRTPDETP